MNSPASTPPGWDQLAPRWPNSAASRFVEAAGLRWHVQVAGAGPALLLLHGTGAASFSWGDVLPLLTPRFTVIVPDLPGHGFTAAPHRDLLTLPGMGRACGALLNSLGLTPVLAAGHSAGAAIIIRMALDGAFAPSGLVGINPALLPPPALYRELVAPFMHRLATTRLVSAPAAALARRHGVIASLLRATQTSVTPGNRWLYEQMLGSEQRVHGVLSMMAGWSLTELVADMPRLAVPLQLVAGTRDPWITLDELRSLSRKTPGSTLDTMPGGHLLHEEHPAAIARLLTESAARLSP
jgi:magnesium chelatase accessory protein